MNYGCSHFSLIISLANLSFVWDFDDVVFVMIAFQCTYIASSSF